MAIIRECDRCSSRTKVETLRMPALGERVDLGAVLARSGGPDYRELDLCLRCRVLLLQFYKPEEKIEPNQ